MTSVLIWGILTKHPPRAQTIRRQTYALSCCGTHRLNNWTESGFQYYREEPTGGAQVPCLSSLCAFPGKVQSSYLGTSPVEWCLSPTRFCNVHLRPMSLCFAHDLRILLCILLQELNKEMYKQLPHSLSTLLYNVHIICIQDLGSVVFSALISLSGRSYFLLLNSYQWVGKPVNFLMGLSWRQGQ